MKAWADSQVQASGSIPVRNKSQGQILGQKTRDQEQDQGHKEDQSREIEIDHKISLCQGLKGHRQGHEMVQSLGHEEGQSQVHKGHRHQGDEEGHHHHRNE